MNRETGRQGYASRRIFVTFRCQRAGSHGDILVDCRTCALYVSLDITDVDSVLGCLFYVVVGSVSDVSEVHSTPSSASTTSATTTRYNLPRTEHQ
jgi:hypothetical protein